MSTASLHAQSVPAIIPQHPQSQTLKNVTSGLVMSIGARIKGIFNNLAPKPWKTEPSNDDPSGWKHEPEQNRALATFGAGCYWGTEKFFCTDFAQKYPDGAIIGTSVGFMSPNPNAMKNPNYY